MSNLIIGTDFFCLKTTLFWFVFVCAFVFGMFVPNCVHDLHCILCWNHLIDIALALGELCGNIG